MVVVEAVLAELTRCGVLRVPSALALGLLWNPASKD